MKTTLKVYSLIIEGGGEIEATEFNLYADNLIINDGALIHAYKYLASLLNYLNVISFFINLYKS